MKQPIPSSPNVPPALGSGVEGSYFLGARDTFSQKTTILIGDVRAKLRELPDESVQCVVTSPPYWGLRDYGTTPQVWGGASTCDHEWTVAGARPSKDRQHLKELGERMGCGGGDKHSADAAKYPTSKGCTCAICGAWLGELGLEPTPELFVEHVVEVFREVKRVLRKDGTAWVNMGDCYASGGAGKCDRGPRRPDVNGRGEEQVTVKGDRGGRKDSMGKAAYRDEVDQPNRKPIPGLKPKDLVGQPWRVAFGLQADGWFLRSDIIWHKPNPMPESIADRPTKAHEYIFLLSKSPRYFYDKEAIKEVASPNSHARISQANFANQTGGAKDYANGTNPNRSMRKTLENFARAAGVNPKAAVNAVGSKQNASFAASVALPVLKRNARSVWSIPTEPYPEAHYATFPSAIPRRCILAGTKLGDVVLDPFGGSGTTAAVAVSLGRSAILIDLNPANEPLMRGRIAKGFAPLKAKRPRKCETRELALEEVA